MRAFLVGLVVVSGLLAAPAPPSTSDKVAGLIKQLASSDARDRETAQKALEEIGLPALEPLQKAALTGDADFAQRANALAKRIQFLSDSTSIFAATVVDANFKDVPLTEVVAALAKASGYPIKVLDADKLKDRKITLTLGKVTFWKAIEEVCKTGKVALVDGVNIRDDGIVNIRPGVPVVRPVRPLPAIPVLPPARVVPKEEAKDEVKPKEEKPKEEKKEQPKEEIKEAPKVPARAALQPVPVPVPLPAPAPKIGVPSVRNPVVPDIAIIDKELTFPTCASGVFLIRGVSSGQLTPAQARNYDFALHIFAEPKIGSFSASSIHVTKMIDDQDQIRELGPSRNPPKGRADVFQNNPSVNRRSTPFATYPLALAAAPKEATSLKEMHGTFHAQILSQPYEFASLKELVKEKSTVGSNGVKLKLLDFTKNPDNTYTLIAEVTYPGTLTPEIVREEAPNVPMAKGFVVARTVLNGSGLRLTDKDGNYFPMRSIQTQKKLIDLTYPYHALVGGLLPGHQVRYAHETIATVTAIYGTPAGKESTPQRLSFVAGQSKNLIIPFELKNLPLK